MPDLLRRLSGHEAARFVVAGAVNTLVSLVAYWVLLTVSPYTVAYTVSFVLGALTAFALNTYFVFRIPWSWKKLAAYPIVQGLNYLVGLAFLWLVITLGVPDHLAPLLSIPATIPVNFVMSRALMRDRQVPGADAAEGFRSR